MWKKIHRSILFLHSFMIYEKAFWRACHEYIYIGYLGSKLAATSCIKKIMNTILCCLKNIVFLQFAFFFFVCFLSDSSPILDHCPEGSLTHPMWNHNVFILTLSWRRSLSYRDQSFDLQGKSVDCFLYDSDFRDERVLSFTFGRTRKGLRNISLRHFMTEVYW